MSSLNEWIPAVDGECPEEAKGWKAGEYEWKDSSGQIYAPVYCDADVELPTVLSLSAVRKIKLDKTAPEVSGLTIDFINNRALEVLSTPFHASYLGQILTINKESLNSISRIYSSSEAEPTLQPIASPAKQMRDAIEGWGALSDNKKKGEVLSWCGEWKGLKG